ncbi:M57 family metalloprotease [Aquimarina sp. AU58]|uniref:M57 family metalloprotease n=1 Tax=Aquimarina sp. AU58 TaxID=1874112 RepID=UPI000D651B69|nr:M57 family metalloprotease [Aquimarina sp. AU58]
MKKIKLLALCAIVAGFTTSCEKKEVSSETQEEAVKEPLSKAHIQGLLDAGVNPNGAEYITLKRPDGSTAKAIKSHDIAIALDNLAEQALEKMDNGTKQYRTRNLVSQGRTINVIGYTGRGRALTSKMRTGLQWAVNNYNAVSTSLTFRLTFSASTNGDIVVQNFGGSSAGGQAEFPSGGRPGKFIEIYGGIDNYSANVVEHLMTHEMGHAVGLRHTNYARRNCRDSNNEGQGSIGAIHVPGTPTANQTGQQGLDTDSVMIACFSGNEDGEFSNYDRIALRYMY